MGLKPWEFEQMDMVQYIDYAKGIRIREAKAQEPHRMIYWILRATNSKKPVTYSEIKRQWPLYTDNQDKLPIQQMNAQWNNLKALENAVNNGQAGV